MNKLLKVSFITLICSIFMAITAFAGEWSWEDAEGHHNRSILLEDDRNFDEDVVHRYGRGDYLAEGSVRIADLEDGTIEIQVRTLAYVYVDRIIHSVFLDMWDEDEEDWVMLYNWDFEKLKEDVENEELSMLITTFTVSGCEVGRYYRLRGLHGVELYDELEACATETDGVRLTNLWN